MTPEQFIAAGQRVYGRKRWKSLLARDLAVDVCTIHRLVHRPVIPGPYEIAITALLENKREQALVVLRPTLVAERSGDPARKDG